MVKLPKTNNTFSVIRFEYRDLEIGFWITFEVPHTKHNWDWVLAHPNTAFIRIVRHTI